MIEEKTATDPVVEANRALLLERSQAGIAKYGVTLAGANLNRAQLLRHLLEELLDAGNYVQAELMREQAVLSASGQDAQFRQGWEEGMADAANAISDDDSANVLANLESELAALLPGTHYMDPPDGGSVTLLEQVQRMAEDAARYRWLVSKAFNVELIGDGDDSPMFSTSYCYSGTGENFAKWVTGCIDCARAATKEGQG